MTVALLHTKQTEAYNNRKLAIQLVSYENVKGKLQDGACCDGHGMHSSWCPPDLCDTSFYFCVGLTSNYSAQVFRVHII
jgi:hypothetical protein